MHCRAVNLAAQILTRGDSPEASAAAGYVQSGAYFGAGSGTIRQEWDVALAALVGRLEVAVVMGDAALSGASNRGQRRM